MGGPPEEEEEPTSAQVAGLHKRVVLLKQAPYVDFGVWVPFGRRALKLQKFRVYTPLGDGSFLMREMPGPQNFQQWQACWKVFKTASLMLGIIYLFDCLAELREVGGTPGDPVAGCVRADMPSGGQGQGGETGEDQAELRCRGNTRQINAIGLGRERTVDRMPAGVDKR